MSRATERVVDDVKRVVANVKHVNKTFVDDMLMTSNMQELQDANEIFDPAFASAHHESDLGLAVFLISCFSFSALVLVHAVN